MFTYYMLLQASGVTEGAPEITQAAGDASFMSRYFADWRFLLQRIGQSVALLHIEPDFWGYAEQQSEDPTSLKAAVASANGTFVDDAERRMAAKFFPKAAVYTPKPAFGESIAAGGIWQTICAAQALRRQELPPLLGKTPTLGLTTAERPAGEPWERAVITSCGMNQQFAGLALRR